MHNVDIRVFDPADTEAVVALWQLIFPNEPDWNAPHTVIQTKLTMQPELFFVASDAGRLVGTVMAGFDGVRGWVHKLAVHPDYRRRGIAAELMQRAEAGLKEIGCAKLNLQVRASNEAVVRFYEALGYTTEARLSLGKPLRD